MAAPHPSLALASLRFSLARRYASFTSQNGASSPHQQEAQQPQSPYGRFDAPQQPPPSHSPYGRFDAPPLSPPAAEWGGAIGDEIEGFLTSANAAFEQRDLDVCRLLLRSLNSLCAAPPLKGSQRGDAVLKEVARIEASLQAIEADEQEPPAPPLEQSSLPLEARAPSSLPLEASLLDDVKHRALNGSFSEALSLIEPHAPIIQGTKPGDWPRLDKPKRTDSPQLTAQAYRLRGDIHMMLALSRPPPPDVDDEDLFSARLACVMRTERSEGAGGRGAKATRRAGRRGSGGLHPDMPACAAEEQQQQLFAPLAIVLPQLNLFLRRYEPGLALATDLALESNEAHAQLAGMYVRASAAAESGRASEPRSEPRREDEAGGE